MLADLLRAHGHGLGEASGGGEIIRCPFANEHTDPEKTGGTVVWNAADSDCGNALIFCHHASCQKAERKTQHFLQKMMENNMFDEEALFDENYLLPPEEVESHAEVEEEDSADDGPALVKEWDFMRVCEYVQKRIDARNAETPTIFAGAEGLVTVRDGQITALDRDTFARIVNDWVRFAKPKGDDGQIGVAMPREVRDYLFVCAPAHYPPLRGIVTAPFYARSGALVDVPGHHPSSKVYLTSRQPLSAPVSVVPSEAEVEEAKRLLVEEVLADFPLDGLTRAEIMASLTGTAIPAVTHAVALMLQPFMRELIDGPTPGYVFTKPAPGTGATLLVETITSIYGGASAPTLRMPHRKEEVEKTLSTVLRDGSSHCFFDNINIALDSGDLASAMTSTYYKTRILGKTESVQVPVRCTWIFTANNLQASGELQRRMVFIPLDAHSAAPAQRSGWRHTDLTGWVRQHHSELTWACLTLIQNWIAQSMPAGTATLGSYEAWAKVMGGVVGAAGFGGFLEGQAEIRAAATADADAALAELRKRLADPLCGAA